MKLINDYTLLDKVKWNRFVFDHPNGNIFHTYEMYELYLKEANYTPVLVAYLSDFGDIEGLIVGEILKERRGFIGVLTARAIIFGGPLVLENNKEVFDRLLVEFNTLTDSKVVFSQFRNLWDISVFKENFQKRNYKYEDHLDILFNLKSGTEQLWTEMSSTRKKQINRGLKRGVNIEIKESLNQEELISCYKILKEVYEDVKLPFPKLEFFENASTVFREKKYLKSALAYFENEIIGFRFFLCYNGLIYDWYAGSKKAHYEKYPNDILPWAIIKWGSENDYHTFDFGGAGKPGVHYGVRDYKLKFGGQLVSFGRFEKISKPYIYYPAFWSLKLIRKFPTRRKKTA